MIIGAQKAGTTSLLRYLGEHPNCISHPQKEFSYFTDKIEFDEGLTLAMKKYFSHNPNTEGKLIVAKNAGLFTDMNGLARLKKNNPNCQLVFILRNPVERTYSSYLMEKNFGTVNFDFKDLPELIKKHQYNLEDTWDFDFFIEYSLYSHHLKNIYSLFPKENINIVLYEDLKDDTSKICKQLFRKLNIDDSFTPNVEMRYNVTQKTRSHTYARIIKHLLRNQNPLKKFIKLFLPGHKVYKYGEILRDVNKTEKKHSPIDEDVKLFLINYYKPYNAELSEMIGKDLSAWNY
jgi:hypothetical protein